MIKGINLDTSSHNWLKENDARVIAQVAEFVVAFSKHTRLDAQKYHIPYHERTSDFEHDLEQIFERLLTDS